MDGLPRRRLPRARPASGLLTCRSTAATRSATQECNLTDDYLGNGYSRWPFFEYLVEQYGSSFVKDIFAQGVAGSPSTTATGASSAALVAKGTTLADTYDDWIAADVSGAYTVPSLQAQAARGVRRADQHGNAPPRRSPCRRSPSTTSRRASSVRPRRRLGHRRLLRGDARADRDASRRHVIEAGVLLEHAGTPLVALSVNGEHGDRGHSVGHLPRGRPPRAISRSRMRRRPSTPPTSSSSDAHRRLLDARRPPRTLPRAWPSRLPRSRSPRRIPRRRSRLRAPAPDALRRRRRRSG